LKQYRNQDEEFYVVIERDEDGFYVAEVPSLKGCYSQGNTIDELLNNIREVIEMALKAAILKNLTL